MRVMDFEVTNHTWLLCRKVIEVRLKKRVIRTSDEEETTFGTFLEIVKTDIPSLFGSYVFLQIEFGDEVYSIGK